MDGDEMLVVTRKAQEGVMIGADIEVVVVRVGEGRVLLGIRAPEEMLILREELGPGPLARTLATGEVEVNPASPVGPEL